MKTSRLFLAVAVLVLASIACQAVMGGGSPGTPSIPSSYNNGTVGTSDTGGAPTPADSNDGVSPEASPTPSSGTDVIVGTWEGTYQGDAVQFVFESNGNFILNITGTEAGGGLYAVDYSTVPVELDLHYSDGMDVYSIIEFTDSNIIRMENADPGDPRPTSFSDFAVLTRVIP
jgi:hypothetical protein